MSEVVHNINKDMSDFDLIDVESLDFSDDQTCLYKVPEDSGQKVDMVDWSLSLEWPVYEDEDYQKTEKALYMMIDEILRNEVLAMPDKHKFDSRTYVKPKKRVQRPSIQNIVEGSSNPPSISPHTSLNLSTNKYLTYNKYSSPLGPMLRLKTFSVEANTDNSNAVKEFAMKRRSLVQDEEPAENVDTTLVTAVSERLSPEHTPSKPINIDLSQPANNLHNTFNKGMLMNDRGSLNMYQSGESLMRMSPPSLVSSLLMESSGNFNHESLDGRKSLPFQRDSGVMSGRDSIDPMVTSMTLSILDEKDMSTSFLSQTTYPDNESFMDSLPPSLVNSVNSSYIVSNTSKARPDSLESANNIFSSTTFTRLEQSEKLLSARPRHQMYNSFTKRENPMRNSESYTKTREEACQIDSSKILNENTDKKDASNVAKPDMAETITLHYSNNKFRRSNGAEKENVNAFEKDDAFYKDMETKNVDAGKNSLNVTLDKQELNEIIQARKKLSLARKALPEPEKLPNQVDIPNSSPTKTYLSPTQTMTVPRKSMENASELLSRRRGVTNGFEKEDPVREPPKRNATFKMTSRKASSVDTTVVHVKDDSHIIDINSATMNLIDSTERTLVHEEWGLQERAMVGSSESTDTATFSSSSPPDSVPDTAHDPAHVASTPLTLRKTNKMDLMNLHTTISPIYNMVDDKSYTVTNAPCNSTATVDAHNATVINSATLVKKSAKRDIMSGKVSPEKKMFGPTAPAKPPPGKVASYSGMAPPSAITLPRKTSLPTSKLRQYSSHKELRIPVSSNGVIPTTSRPSVGRAMVRRNVYASNPALSPTHPAPPAPVRKDTFTIAAQPQSLKDEEISARPVLTNPPALVRQGTETLRRERPQSQLVQPKDLRAAAPSSYVPMSMRNHHLPPPATRPYSVAGASQLRVNRPTSVPVHRQQVIPPEPRPASGCDARPAPPRPSRLPAPRRTIRPPSVYSVAPTADVDHY